jgi:diaminopimelate epimerase
MRTFYKYHGAGNDFIMTDNRNKEFNENSQYIKTLCDRHFGVGADGIILMENSDNADCFMNYYNNDGTLAEMCGNGVRCLAKFFLENTKKNKSNIKELLIDTRAGIKKIVCNIDGSFSVDMGAPIFSHKDFPDTPVVLENISFKCVSMGNPHAVAEVKSLNDIDLKIIGPKIENGPHFPNKINVEFVEKISDNHYKVKVWERGCGATLACGTGACAVYAILKHIGVSYVEKEVILEFPGGNLYLSENSEGHIILRGPAECVFEGEIN